MLFYSRKKYIFSMRSLYNSIREKVLGESKLMKKLLLIIDSFWERNSFYQQIHSKSELCEIKKRLSNSTYQFCSMYRSWIPKPNKPGKLRPITQPNKVDILVMEALAHLLNLVFEEIFVSQSHGFRPGRGSISFFLQVQGWGLVDRLVKSDVVACFDSIDHRLLIDEIQFHLGEENNNIVIRISAFLKTRICDKKGKDYSSQTKGIPQGCPVSPVLMNVLLHKLDINIEGVKKIVKREVSHSISTPILRGDNTCSPSEN